MSKSGEKLDKALGTSFYKDKDIKKVATISAEGSVFLTVIPTTILLVIIILSTNSLVSKEEFLFYAVIRFSIAMIVLAMVWKTTYKVIYNKVMKENN